MDSFGCPLTNQWFVLMCCCYDIMATSICPATPLTTIYKDTQLLANPAYTKLMTSPGI